MTDSAVDQRVEQRAHRQWRRHVGTYVVLHAPEGSFAATRAVALHQEAERAASVLARLLRPAGDRFGARLDLVLLDAGTEETMGAGDAPAVERPIVQIVQPAAADTLPMAALTEALIERWLEVAAPAPLLVAGLAGLVAARSGRGPRLPAHDDAARAALAAARSRSILVRAAQVLTGEDEREDGAIDGVATSFVAFLVDRFGADSVARLVAAGNLGDDALVATLGQPLGSLEEAWIASLRRRARGGSAYRSLVRHLVPLLRPYWAHAVAALALMLVGVVLTLAAPLTIMYLIDHVIPHAKGHYGDLLRYTGLLLLIFGVDAVIGSGRGYLLHWLDDRVVTTLHLRFFDHLQQLPHGFYTHTKSADLMAALFEDLREIRAAMAMVAGAGLYQLLLAIATAITFLVLDPLLGVLVLVVVPVFAVGYAALRSRWHRMARLAQASQAEAEQVALESLTAHGEIKAFGLERHVVERYHRHHAAMLAAHLRQVRLGLRFESSLRLAAGLGQVVVFGVGGYQVIAGEGATVGTLFAFAHLLPLFYDPIERLAGISHTVEEASAAFDRVDELAAEPVGIADSPEATPLPPLAHEVRFERVTFGYGGDRPILRDLSLVIPEGAHVALIGPTGCGKSTIVNLLMRFWDPEEGRVLIDGHDVREVTLASLRGQIGLVSQETHIFNASIRDNIAVGRLDATDAEIEAAARAAKLDTFIASLPAGFHTTMGERGVRMSGGQRQRLAIARALVRDPRLLILDEATSALDPQTESEIQETLDAITPGRTTISITHRLAAVATADRILVLDGGRVVEEGRHTELVRAGGLYQRLYEEQMHYLHGGGMLRIGVDPARLLAIPLFTEMDRDALTIVADRFMLERYAAGVEVVRQGEPGDKLYVVSRGQLECVVSDGAGERVLNPLVEGDYFGEMALVTGQPRTATVRTVMPTQLYSLSAADFTMLMTQVPCVREAVTQVVARRAAALTDGADGDLGRRVTADPPEERASRR